MWNPFLTPVRETVTWTAGCGRGLASGAGTLKWVGDDGSTASEDTGDAARRQVHRPLGHPLRGRERRGRPVRGAFPTPPWTAQNVAHTLHRQDRLYSSNTTSRVGTRASVAKPRGGNRPTNVAALRRAFTFAGIRVHDPRIRRSTSTGMRTFYRASSCDTPGNQGVTTDRMSKSTTPNRKSALDGVRSIWAALAAPREGNRHTSETRRRQSANRDGPRRTTKAGATATCWLSATRTRTCIRRCEAGRERAGSSSDAASSGIGAATRQAKTGPPATWRAPKSRASISYCPLAEIPGAVAAAVRAIDSDVRDIVDIRHEGSTSPVEFEWIGLERSLEGGTTRGAINTSVDAFAVADTGARRRAYLMEWKYVEDYNSAEDKGLGDKGETRRRRYAGLYTAESSAFSGAVPMDELLYDPFYQLMRPAPPG